MKSTSSAYANSFEISSANEVVGLGSAGRTSLRACSKYIVKRTELKLSPCGVPTLLVNGFDVEVPFILASMAVPLRRNCISLCSSALILLYRGDGVYLSRQRPLTYLCRKFL